MLISSTKDLVRHGFFLISGKAGVGKTQMAATFPDSQRVLFVDLENGAATVRDANLPYINLTKDDKGVQIARPMRFKKLMELRSWLATEKRPYDFIFIDSITEVAQCLLEDAKAKFPLEKDKFKIWDLYGSSLEDLIKSFRDMTEYTVAFTVLVDENIDDFKQKSFSYQVKGQMKDQLAGFFDSVFFLTVDKEGKRFVKTKLTQSYTAKDRTKTLGETEEPDFSKILEKMKGQK